MKNNIKMDLTYFYRLLNTKREKSCKREIDSLSNPTKLSLSLLTEVNCAIRSTLLVNDYRSIQEATEYIDNSLKNAVCQIKTKSQEKPKDNQYYTNLALDYYSHLMLLLKAYGKAKSLECDDSKQCIKKYYEKVNNAINEKSSHSLLIKWKNIINKQFEKTCDFKITCWSLGRDYNKEWIELLENSYRLELVTKLQTQLISSVTTAIENDFDTGFKSISTSTQLCSKKKASYKNTAQVHVTKLAHLQCSNKQTTSQCDEINKKQNQISELLTKINKLKTKDCSTTVPLSPQGCYYDMHNGIHECRMIE